MVEGKFRRSFLCASQLAEELRAVLVKAPASESVAIGEKVAAVERVVSWIERVSR